MRTRAFCLLSAATGTLLIACETDAGSSDAAPETIVEIIGDTTVVRTLSGSVWDTEATLVPEITIGRLDGPEGENIRRQSPLGRVATPDEVAYAVAFLASEGAEFTTGAILDVNGASYLRS